MEAMGGVSDLSTYESAALQNVVTYKWDNYAFAWHTASFICLAAYIICICFYVQNIYVDYKYKGEKFSSDDAKRYHSNYTTALWLTTIQPVLIYMVDLYSHIVRGEVKHFLMSSHFYIDTTFIGGNVVNGWFQMAYGD